MAQIIQHALARAALIVIAILPISPAVAQTQQQINWCLHKDDAFSPALRIDGCTATIKSGRQSGKDLSRVFYNRGIAYAKNGQQDRAIADFDQAIRLDPDSIFALNNRGAAYARKGQFDNAIADFNEAIRIDASNALTYNNRGIAYAKKGQYDRAVEDFDQAVRFDPKDASTLKNLSLAKQLRGDTAGANTEVAIASKNRGLAEQMKETSPGAETIEANTLKNGNPVEPPKVNSSNTASPITTSPIATAPIATAPINTVPITTPPLTTKNEERAFHQRGAAQKLNDTSTEARSKIASASKSSRRVNFTNKNRSKVQHASVRSHRSKSQPALVRFFRKHNLITDFRKVLRLASRRSNSSQRTSY